MPIDKLNKLLLVWDRWYISNTKALETGPDAMTLWVAVEQSAIQLYMINNIYILIHKNELAEYHNCTTLASL